MFFAGSSFESPFGLIFDLVLRSFSNNISTKMATEGPKRRSRGAWREGLILRGLRASSSEGGGNPVGAVSGARRLLPEGSDQYIISFWATSGGKPKE